MRSARGNLPTGPAGPARRCLRRQGEKGKAVQRLSESADDCLRRARRTTISRTRSPAEAAAGAGDGQPGKVILTDPEIIKLIASIRGRRAATAGGRGRVGKDRSTRRRRARSSCRARRRCRQCYERALKKNSRCSTRRVWALTLDITVRPRDRRGRRGQPLGRQGDDRVLSRPRRCAGSSPAFPARAVTIEQKVTLTPAKT